MSLPGRLVELPSGLRCGRVFVATVAFPTSGASGLAPLCLLHGLLLSHGSFAPVLDRLAQIRPLILLDLPGHGESDRPSPLRFAYDLPALAESVRAVLDALEVPRAAFLGHSLGGAVAATLAARHPERCERLVLASPTLLPLELAPALKLLLTPLLGPALLRHGLRRSDLRRFLARSLYRDPALLTVQKLDYHWERLCRAGSRDALRACLHTLATLHPPDRSVLAAPGALAAVPTLLLWGEEDRCVPLWRGKELARLWPQAAFEVIPACGHCPFEERPQEFLRAVLPFLGGGDR